MFHIPESLLGSLLLMLKFLQLAELFIKATQPVCGENERVDGEHEAYYDSHSFEVLKQRRRDFEFGHADFSTIAR